MIEQGDILRIQGISFPVLVVSTNVYNETGRAIVCPIIAKEKNTSPTTFYLRDLGTVLCDQVHFIDLSVRSFKMTGSVSMNDIVEISGIIESLFDYY